MRFRGYLPVVPPYSGICPVSKKSKISRIAHCLGISQKVSSDYTPRNYIKSLDLAQTQTCYPAILNVSISYSCPPKSITTLTRPRQNSVILLAHSPVNPTEPYCYSKRRNKTITHQETIRAGLATQGCRSKTDSLQKVAQQEIGTAHSASLQSCNEKQLLRLSECSADNRLDAQRQGDPEFIFRH